MVERFLARLLGKGVCANVGDLVICTETRSGSFHQVSLSHALEPSTSFPVSIKRHIKSVGATQDWFLFLGGNMRYSFNIGLDPKETVGFGE